MSTDRSHIVTLFCLTFVLGACARAVDGAPGVATTNSAKISNEAAVLEVAKARCQRLAECNDYSNGHKFAGEAQCMKAYQDESTHLSLVRDCPYGVDQGHLDNCIAELVDEQCDAHEGPVTGMPGCSSYCAPAEYGR